jgi:uncharacterized DUF497 family protein
MALKFEWDENKSKLNFKKHGVDFKENENTMRDEYDFSKGVRGKHYKAYREGHTVVINKNDGTQSIQYFKEEDGAVMLDPDLKIHFPNSESVNKALRSLISQH